MVLRVSQSIFSRVEFRVAVTEVRTFWCSVERKGSTPLKAARR
jgi:hypothetical protein